MKGDPTSPFHLAVFQAQRNIISYALETADNDWHLARDRLGLSTSHFRYYCERLGFPLPETKRHRVGASVNQSTESKHEEHDDAEGATGDSDPVEDMA